MIYFHAYSKVKEYLHNSLWMMGDKIISLCVGFFVTVVLARYLGPEDFGLYSYAVSLAALFSAAGHLGLSGLLVREVIKKPEERGAILGTALALKFIGMGVGYLILLGYAAVYEGFESVEFSVLALAGTVLLFKPFDIVDFWFQAFVQVRFVTYARLAGLVVGSGFKLLFVVLGFSVTYFAAANLFQAVAIAVGLMFAYQINASLKISAWRFCWKKAKELFAQGWVICLGTIFSIVYLKVDQVMLRWFDGSEAVGVYAVAVQLSEAWYFVPTAIVASVFPKLISLREESESEFDLRLQQLFDLLFVLAISVALVMSIFSDWVVMFFFGESYSESAVVLVIHVWAAIFIFMRAAFSKWILIEGLLMFSVITQGLGALVNLGLNYIMIPRFGVQGAAYATLISYAFASFFSLAISKETRPVFFMMLKSFFCITRYTNMKAWR